MTLKIKTINDIRKAADIIVGKLIKGNLAYFNIVVADSTGFSQCFFTPRTEIRGKEETMIFVGDYEKLMMLLLSHPKVSEITYDAAENAVSAVFDNPFELYEEST